MRFHVNHHIFNFAFIKAAFGGGKVGKKYSKLQTMIITGCVTNILFLILLWIFLRRTCTDFKSRDGCH